jgi:hypothetical protein
MTHPGLPDCDLSRLSPEDLARVRHWAEDRILNAITPLSFRLQCRGEACLAPTESAMACDKVLQAATRAVERLENIVAEVRALHDGRG